MRVARGSCNFSHHVFRDLPSLLKAGDLIVLNDTRVFPARLLGHRGPDGGKVEALLLHCEGPGLWWALVRPGKKIKTGERLVFAPGRLEAIVESYGHQGGGERLLRFSYKEDWWNLLEEIGRTPLPPYILKARKHTDWPPEMTRHAADAIPEVAEDRTRYQTVYAGDERASVAAPTAGLHFSQSVFDELERRGIERVFLQLHVGAGTFQPVKTDTIEEHPMHAEFFRIPRETAERITAARNEGRRIVAVGTTVVRALETAALVTKGIAENIFEAESLGAHGKVKETETRGEKSDVDASLIVSPVAGWTRLMIAPGFSFQAVDALITNFHLPRSTLLLLVSALAGFETIREAYAEAIRERYRFYSYGDCMLIE